VQGSNICLEEAEEITATSYPELPFALFPVTLSFLLFSHCMHCWQLTIYYLHSNHSYLDSRGPERLVKLHSTSFSSISTSLFFPLISILLHSPTHSIIFSQIFLFNSLSSHLHFLNHSYFLPLTPIFNLPGALPPYPQKSIILTASFCTFKYYHCTSILFPFLPPIYIFSQVQQILQ
jgi:hypothetical protein